MSQGNPMEVSEYLSPVPFFTDYEEAKDINEITQGDIFVSETLKELVIVVTNACDLESRGGKRKTEFIHLIPLKPIPDAFFQEFSRDQWANLIGQTDNHSMYFPFHAKFGMEENNGFIVDPGMIFTENLATFFSQSNVEILSRLKRPYLDLLSWKTGYLFNRIPVDQPEKSILKNVYDAIKSK
jgi:hypothetical protein